MKPNRLVSTILAMLLCLSGVSRQVQAQQPASAANQTTGSADGVGESDLSKLLAQAQRGRRAGFSLMPASRYGSLSVAAASSNSAVHGSGTVGKLPLWVDVRPNGDSTLGDSIITQLNGNIGIGTSTPTSKLTVQGMIETTLGGYKFPDGTVQTTAAVSGLQSVAHNATLMGNGTTGSPLGVTVPLVLNGSFENSAIISVHNTAVGGAGVVGISIDNIGVAGLTENYNGVYGVSSSTDPGHAGVSGYCTSCSGVMGQGTIGVLGVSPFGNGVGVRGTGSVGVRGEGSNNGSVGVEATGGESFTDGGVGLIATGGAALGVQGFTGTGGNGVETTGGTSNGGGFGGHGVVAQGGNFNGRGVVAKGGVGPVGYGVEAIGGDSTGSGSTAGAGVFAKGGASSGSNSESGFGIFAIAGDATNGAMRGKAGRFEGDVSISDNLTVSGNLDVEGSKHFKIDHPLDPENKYLLHASVESSEVLNIYSGNVITDTKGEATVTLPAWFEALNRDLRYQLTVIGTFAQAIVASEVQNNRFTIKTSAPKVKVSWQVTGVRSDKAMKKQPFKAEEDKPQRERGHYLQPELYGQPEERSVEWARHPELMKQLNQQRLEARRAEKPRKQMGH